MEISYSSDPGMVRPNNEDSYLVVPPWKEPGLSSGLCLFAVADGMGGHKGGEVASRLALDVLQAMVFNSDPLKAGTEDLENAILEANSRVFQFSRQNPDLSGMGTTLTAGLIAGSRLLVGHVGDSRLYRLRQGVLEQISSDHSLIADQVKSGRLSAEAAKNHPARHILSRALGVREFLKIDTLSLELATDDIFLLCSDGVTTHLEDPKIKELLQRKPFKSVARAIVDEANSMGGKDNSTIVAFHIRELPIPFPGRYSWQRLREIIYYWGVK